MDERFLSLDRYGCLKPPLSLWLCTIFMLRHWCLLVLVAISGSRSAENVHWAYGLVSLPGLLAEAPVWLLVVAWMRRIPEAGAWARGLWARGREILTGAAALDIAWTAWYLSNQPDWNPWPERAVLCLAIIEVLMVVGIWRSALYRQLFQEFPVQNTQKDRSQ